jgi:hypothetical protein
MPQESRATADRRPAQETPGHMDSSTLRYTRHLATTGAPLYMRRATRNDFETIERMIEDAKDRLRELGTDQWSDDWADGPGAELDQREKDMARRVQTPGCRIP